MFSKAARQKRHRKPLARNDFLAILPVNAAIIKGVGLNRGRPFKKRTQAQNASSTPTLFPKGKSQSSTLPGATERMVSSSIKFPGHPVCSQVFS